MTTLNEVTAFLNEEPEGCHNSDSSLNVGFDTLQAFLSPIDAERPLVATPGFLSIIIPSFGFVDLADVDVWRAYEFHGRNNWRELDLAERRRRLIVDPSLLRID